MASLPEEIECTNRLAQWIGLLTIALLQFGGMVLGTSVVWSWAVQASIEHGLIAGGILGALFGTFVSLACTDATSDYYRIRERYVGAGLIFVPLLILVAGIGGIVGAITHLAWGS